MYADVLRIMVVAIGFTLLGPEVVCGQNQKCFGSWWGGMQVQPARNIEIGAVKAYQYTDRVGPYTEIMIRTQPMYLIPGHFAGEINGYIAKLDSAGFTTIDVVHYSYGGYLLQGRTNAKQKEKNEGCNLASGGKRLKKMKTNRDRDNEGCAWAKGDKPLKKMKTNRDRDNEGCGWAKGGKPLRKMKTDRDRSREGCSDTIGKRKHKARRSFRQSSGCNLARSGRKGPYGGRRIPAKLQCYD